MSTDVKYKIQVARDQLAAKDMTVGRFYLTRKNYSAAVNRFHDVLAKYQTTRHAEEALYRLTEAYFAMGVVNEAQTAAAILGHNFPDSSWYKDAHALLATGGVAPAGASGLLALQDRQDARRQLSGRMGEPRRRNE